MSYITKEILDNGTTIKRFVGVNSVGYTDMRHNGNVIATSKTTLKIGTQASDRINLEIKIKDFEHYVSINKVKLVVKTSDVNTNRILYLTSESSITSDEDDKVDEFKSSDGQTYELDFSKYLNEDNGQVLYFSIRSDVETYIKSQFYEDCPEIVVEYIASDQCFLNQKYVSGNAGRALDYNINLRTGQPFFTKNLVSAGGNLMPMNLNLVFNGIGANEEIFTGMPHGWKTNYHQKVEKDEDNDYYTYIDALGIRHTFNKALNANNIYFDIAGTGFILTVNSDNTVTIDQGYKNYLDFNSNGYLVKIRKVVGSNTIQTTIDYNTLNNSIDSITDGMGRTLYFIYNLPDIGISMSGVPEITLVTQNNKLIRIEECDNRSSEYLYINDLLTTASSDNGEKVVFTYDSIGRVISANDYFYNGTNTLINLRSIVYKLNTTTITNMKGLKIQYSFNEKGEFVGEYEVVNDGNGNLVVVQKNDFETYRNNVNRETYYKYPETEVSGSLISHTGTYGGMTVTSNQICLVSFEYKMSGAFPNRKNSVHKVEVKQGETIIGSIDLDPRIDEEQNVAFLVSCVNNTIPKILLRHEGNNGKTVLKNIKIYKTRKNQIVECVDKLCGGWSTPMNSNKTFYKLPNTVGLSYRNTSGEIVSLNVPISVSDIQQNRDYYKLSNGGHYVWYNNKKGLIANAQDVKLKFLSTEYDLISITAAIVQITDKEKRYIYHGYPPLASQPHHLKYVYECIYRDGTYDSSHKFLSTDYQVLFSEDYNGVKTEYTYDGYGNVLSVSSRGYRVINEYDDCKYLTTQHTSVSPDVESITLYSYDSLGRVIRVTKPNGSVVNYSYDSNSGYLKEISELVGSVQKNTINYSKDNIVDMLNGTKGYSFIYDRYNRPSVAYINNNGTKTMFYNYYNEKTNTTDTEMISYNDDYTEEYIYDKYGNFILKKRGVYDSDLIDELKLFYSDDVVDNVTTTDPNSSELKKTIHSKLRKVIDVRTNNTQKYFYNEEGLLKKITNTSSDNVDSKEYTYDNLDRITEANVKVKDGNEEVLTSTMSITYKDSNLYDTQEVAEIENDVVRKYNSTTYNMAYSKAFTRNSLKWLTNEILQLENYSLEKKYNYENNQVGIASLPKSINYITKYLSSQGSLGTITYTYDSMGNITGISDSVTGNNITYQYDVSGRLVRENNQKLGVTKTYTYTSNGNFAFVSTAPYYTSGNASNVTTTYFNYSSEYPDRFTNYKGATVTYDSNGNMTKISDYIFAWTRGRLLESCAKGGMGYTFSYNALGQRIQKRHSSTNYINYTYDGNKLIKEHRVTDTETYDIDYIYLGDEMVGFAMKNKFYYFVKNLQGDIIKLVNSTNNVIATYVYDAWGNCKVYNSSGVESTSSTWVGNINPIRYRGYYYDVETGLFMVGHRYYNPEWGRWLSPDDIEYLEPQSINGLNLYAYCNNDPVNKYDPTGHSAIGVLLIIGGILISGAITGLGAMANKEDHESNLGAFVGGFIDGAVGALAVAAGLATGGAAGLLMTAGIAFAGGFTGNAVGQAISYGNVQWDLSFMQGGISMLTNSFIFGGLSMAGITQGITWASRFADALKISEVAVGITSFFTTYSLPSVNKLRRNY